MITFTAASEEEVARQEQEEGRRQQEKMALVDHKQRIADTVQALLRTELAEEYDFSDGTTTELRFWSYHWAKEVDLPDRVRLYLHVPGHAEVSRLYLLKERPAAKYVPDGFWAVGGHDGRYSTLPPALAYAKAYHGREVERERLAEERAEEQREMLRLVYTKPEAQSDTDTAFADWLQGSEHAMEAAKHVFDAGAILVELYTNGDW